MGASRLVDRVVFLRGRQRQLLVFAKERSGLTWEAFTARIGVSSYAVLRATYLNERSTLSLGTLSKVIPYLNDPSWRSWIVGIRHEHWGQAKGGSIALKRWHEGMRANQKVYHEIQSRRFLQSRHYNYMTSAGYEVRSLQELLVAENLIANRIRHQYEPSLRCREHVLFPDFFVRTSTRGILIEVSGFRSALNLTRLRWKLKLYRACGVADLLVVVHLAEDNCLKRTLLKELERSVALVPVNEMGTLLSLSVDAKDSVSSLQSVTELGALRRCRRISGKRFHWQRLLKAVPKELWVETLTRAGFPRSEVDHVRTAIEAEERLMEATRTAARNELVPREALVEMIAGAYSGAVYVRFGSMGNLLTAAESSGLGKA